MNNQIVFYEVKDHTLRSYRIYKHKIGTSVELDILVYEEGDSTFDVEVYKTKSQKYIVIASESTLSTECRILDADSPDGQFRIFKTGYPKWNIVLITRITGFWCIQIIKRLIFVCWK